jgi:hypothetical protein
VEVARTSAYETIMKQHMSNLKHIAPSLLANEDFAVLVVASGNHYRELPATVNASSNRAIYSYSMAIPYSSSMLVSL